MLRIHDVAGTAAGAASASEAGAESAAVTATESEAATVAAAGSRRRWQEAVRVGPESVRRTCGEPAAEADAVTDTAAVAVTVSAAAPAAGPSATARNRTRVPAPVPPPGIPVAPDREGPVSRTRGHRRSPPPRGEPGPDGLPCLLQQISSSQTLLPRNRDLTAPETGPPRPRLGRMARRLQRGAVRQTPSGRRSRRRGEVGCSLEGLTGAAGRLSSAAPAAHGASR